MDLFTKPSRFLRLHRGTLTWLAALCLFLARSGNSQGPEIPPELRDLQTTVGIRSDSQEKNGTTYILRGRVEVVYRDMKLNADEASFDETSGDMRAKGHVVFSDSTSNLEADEAYYNVKAGTGWFSNAQGKLQAKLNPRRRMLTTENPFFVRAARVERRSETLFVAEHVWGTTCKCENTGWTISSSRASIEVGDKVITHGSLFRMFRMPLLYVPVTITSIAPQPRKSGFLLPHMGNSSQKGFIIGDGFYWAINPSADLVVGVENYSIRGVASNGRFRATPSATSEFSLEYAGINDKGSGENRENRAPGQSVRATGQAQDIGHGFRAAVDVDYITSLAYRETWSPSFTQAVSAEARQTGFVTKNSGPYSVDVFVSRYQNFLTAEDRPGNSVIIRETPSLSLSGLDQQVSHSPLFVAFDFSAAGVGRTEPNLSIARLAERIDFHPEAVIRTKSFFGFHVTPAVGARITHYGTSLATGGNSLERLLGEFSLDFRPPSLERVFATPHWGQRFKHVFETDVQYRLVRFRDTSSILDVVRYDEMDILAETNEFEYSMTNSLMIRKDVPDSQQEKPQARQLVSWRVSQKYYFDPTFGGALDPGRRTVFEPTITLTGFSFAQGRRLSPIVSSLKFSPHSNYDTEIRADISPYGGILNAGITSHFRSGPVGLSVTDFFINRTAGLSTAVLPPVPASLLPSYHLLRTVATFGEVNRKGFSGAFGIDFNFTQKVALQAVSQVSYNFGCFALDFEYRRFALADVRRENQFRVAVSLANIGTFGNLKSRERLY
jgi:LPS-assembly protein